MELTLNELSGAVVAIDKIMRAVLPIKVSYRLSKMVSLINTELDYLDKARTKLAASYGVDNGKGEIQIKKENIEQFSKEINQLMTEKVELNIERIKLSEIQEVKLSAVDILSLGKILEEDVK